MIKAGEATAAISIPEDFIESMQQGEFKPLQLLMNDKQPFQSDLIFSALESGSDMMAAVQNELYVVSKYTSDLDIPQEDKDNIFNMSMLDMIMSVLQRDAMYEISYITPWENVSLPEYYVISLLLVFIVFSSAYHMSKRNNNDRRAFYRRTVLTSVNIFSAILADTLASTLLVTLQSSVIIVFVFIIFGISWTKLASVLVLLILISWFAVIVYELAMLIFRKNRTAVLTAGLFFAVSVIFSGLIIPVSFWQAIPAFIRDYSFFYWSHNALMQIMYGMTENALMINPAIAILLFYIPFLTLIYVKRMNKVY